MDRYSVGSTISKKVIDDVYEVVLLSKDEIKTNKEVSKPVSKEDTKESKKVSLKEIDDRLMTIDDFLK